MQKPTPRDRPDAEKAPHKETEKALPVAVAFITCHNYVSIPGPRVGADLDALMNALDNDISIHGPRVGADSK